MIGVNRAPVRICHSGRARDLGCDISEKENLNKIVNKKNSLSIPGFSFGSANQVKSSSGVATGQKMDLSHNLGPLILVECSG